jgi:tetratricopeptide (TPR) repeat protein
MFRFFLFSCLISILVITSASAQISGSDMQAFSDAETLQMQGKINEALSILEKLLKDSPNTDLKDEILIQMAGCYIQLGDDDSAIKSYLKIITAKPDSPEASNAVSLLMNIYMQRYQFEDLIAMSNQIIKQYPGTESSAMAIYRVASYLYSKGDNKRAIKEFEGFLEQFPKSTLRSTVFNRLIYLYIAESMLKEAEEKIAISLSENPANTYMLQQMAVIYRKQGKYDEAMNLYQKLLASNPKDTEIYEQMGEIYAEKGDKDKALELWYKIIEISPGQYYLHQILANILKSHGFSDQAVQEYKKAVELQPLASYLYSQLAEIYVINKKFDLAVNVYIDALLALPANFPDRIELVNNVLELCKVEGIYDRVISRLRSNLDKSPNNPSTISTLADIYFYRGDIDNAIEFFKKTVAFNSDNANIMIEKARWLIREQKPEKAEKIYNFILGSYPNTSAEIDAIVSLGQLKAEMNKPEEAIKDLRSAISKSNFLFGQNEMNARGLNLSGQNDRRLPPILTMIGDIYVTQIHDPQSAIIAYTDAMAMSDTRSSPSEIPDLKLKVADCQRLMGLYDTAFEVLNSIPQDQISTSAKANLVPPSNGKIDKIRGDCYFNMGDFENAKKYYKTATKGNLKEEWANDVLDKMALIDEFSNGQLADLLKVYSSLDRIKESGDYENALLGYSSAIKKFPKNDLTDRIQLEIGEILTLKGKYDESIKAYEVLVSSGGEFAPEAQFRIAAIYSQKLKDNQRAVDAYAKLIKDYPDSMLVADARKQLQRLSASGNASGQILP